MNSVSPKVTYYEAKIRYPPEQEHEVIERGSNTNNSLDSQENNIPPQVTEMSL